MTTIAEIRKRLEAATPEPWEIVEGKYSDMFGTSNSGSELCIYNKRDAELIAHAPTDISFLLEKLERCRFAMSLSIRMDDPWIAQTLKEVFGDDDKS